jgi:hypothetical protein
VKITHRRAGAAALAALVLVAGCKAPPKPRKFNNEMARHNQKLASAAKEFAKKLEPLSQGKAASDARGAYQSMVSALTAARKEYDEDALTPNRSNSGPALLERYQTFLIAQQKILDGPLKQALQIAEGGGDPATKWREIQPLLAEANSEEQKWMTDLGKAQQEYAREHNLQLKSGG